MYDKWITVAAESESGTSAVVDVTADYTWIQFISNSILLAIVVICAILSVVFSLKYRRASDDAIRGLHQARMNISMGIMLIAIALIQIFLFEANWLRTIIGAIFLLLGLFNLFAGLRNQRIYKQIVLKNGAKIR